MLKTFALQNRPFAIFDAANKEHRTLFNKFRTTRSWAHCPYQWALDDDSADIVHSISKKLVEHYMNAEFVVKKPRNSRKTVTKSAIRLKKVA
jgi:hypothetical protein